MLRYMLDTNLCIRLLRDRPPGLRPRVNAEADSMCLSTVVLMELYRGALRSARQSEKRAEVDDLASRTTVLTFDAAAADHTADIRVALEAKGNVIGAYDLMIAGHARSRGLIVVTGNLGEFRRVEGLRSEDWLAPDPS